MSHISPDFKTKKAFMEAFKSGINIRVFNPCGLFPMDKAGITTIEAPAEYHKWYLRVAYKNYVVISVVKS